MYLLLSRATIWLCFASISETLAVYGVCRNNLSFWKQFVTIIFFKVLNYERNLQTDKWFYCVIAWESLLFYYFIILQLKRIRAFRKFRQKFLNCSQPRYSRISGERVLTVARTCLTGPKKLGANFRSFYATGLSPTYRAWSRTKFKATLSRWVLFWARSRPVRSRL